MTDVANPEQMLFASTTQAFLEKEGVAESRSRTARLRTCHSTTDWWQRAAELGWASLLVPEELGGGSVSGDGVADLALVAEQIGRTVAPGPLHPVSVVLAGLVEAPGGHEASIEALVSGEAVASWAVYEPTRPFAPLQAATTATRHRVRLPHRRRQGPGRGRRRERRAAGGRRLRRSDQAVPGADRRARCHRHRAEVRRPGQALRPSAIRRCRGRRVRRGRHRRTDSGHHRTPAPDRPGPAVRRDRRDPRRRPRP